MTAESEVHVAGIGYSPLPSRDSSTKAIVASLISAVTKALLDAGVTHDDVTHCVKSAGSKTSKHELQALKSFGEGDVPLDEVKAGTQLDSAFRQVRDNGARCVLMVATEDSAAVALVLVSDGFLLSRAYLKDSSALVRKQDNKTADSREQPSGGLFEMCQLVWTLRGWSQQHGSRKGNKPLRYSSKSDQTYELYRSDGNAIPQWKEVEYRQDGKHRLRYNPASETRDISYEDFEAVCAAGKKHGKGDNRANFKRHGGDRAALAKL